MGRRLRIPVLEPDGHGGAKVRTEYAPSAPRRQRTRDEERARGRVEPWRRTGYSGPYRAERQECIARAGGRCEGCGRVVAKRNRDGSWSTTIGQTHHTVPLREGGMGGPLQLLCPSCHAKADAVLRKKHGDPGYVK